MKSAILLWAAIVLELPTFGRGQGPPSSRTTVPFQPAAARSNVAASPRSVEIAPIPSEPSHTANIPKDCNRQELSAYGSPVMVPLRENLAIGISLAQHEFKAGGSIKTNVWVYNSGDAAAGVLTCSDLDRFKTIGFQVFSADGRPVLSREEQQVNGKCSTDPGAVSAWGVWVCGRNIMFSIPPHACMTRNDYDFAKELTSSYELPSGEYVIRLRSNWQTGINPCNRENPEEFHKRPDDLTFIVRKP